MRHWTESDQSAEVRLTAPDRRQPQPDAYKNRADEMVSSESFAEEQDGQAAPENRHQVHEVTGRVGACKLHTAIVEQV